jgi:methylthioribose-1-phosphate isomerase
VPALVEAIRSLAVRGAPLLGLAGAYGVALAAARGFDVGEAARQLRTARPTMANLDYGVGRAVAAYEAAGGAAGGAGAARAALAEARALHREDEAAAERMTRHGQELLGELLPGGQFRVLTHGNTGALSSGGAGTAFAVLLAAHRAGRLRRLWVAETRPLLQGARLTGWEAARAGMPYAVLADGAAGTLLASGEVDAVVTGADLIAADGSAVQPVGGYPLAVLARHHGVPYVVVAPVTSVAPDTPDGRAVRPATRPGHEVTDLRPGAAIAPVGAQAYNPAFDVTPAELVTAVVTDRGVVEPVDRGNLAAVCSRSLPS